ncbi:hypothetical protein SUGI_0808530 [Cryptomeria japonica]|uniref:F-box/WD-40 repeat-containing protein At3g52030 isoform X1 n=1 Tax=Cryptomeria japonica TaxID=3369 RepID=UPI002414C3E6|nr:F-box/WD-40 repeat-containing protein At3g52030 isoform X1 [Cryptomeria japonica]GLJ39571.1 hypothetical protein SUGI_0808530 [Cryptomeria japonica]
MTSYKENDRSLKRRKNPINDVGADVLLKIFSYLDLLDLARASTVNRSWHSIIERSSLWRDAYYMQRHEFLNHSKDDTLSETSPKDWVRQLMSEQHKSALVHGSGQVCCWKGHSTGVNKCRMRMESILTGVGDQTVRIWSSKNFKCLEEYSSPNRSPLVDVDFDENKIVGLVGGDICIWKRHGNRHLLRGHIQRAYCMCYVDPEAAVGCGDGTIRIFDMYSSQCSRIFREHSGAVTCLSIADERFLISGSSLGSLSVADVVSGQKVASLRQPTAPTGISCLWVKQGSFEVFSGTTSGHAYCWDLRTHKQLWEMRVSSNEIYSIHSLAIDLKTLALGGIDGILRIIDAKSGEILSSYVPAAKMTNISGGLVAKCSASKVSSPIDRIPKSIRRPITCVAVGLNKIVTTHNDKNIMLWTFQRTKVK